MNTQVSTVLARREAHGMDSPLHELVLSDYTDSDSNVRRLVLRTTSHSAPGVLSSLWKHAKTGTLYTVLGFWVETGVGEDDALVHIVYRSLSNQLVWFRPVHEWTQRVGGTPRFLAFGVDWLTKQLGPIKRACLNFDSAPQISLAEAKKLHEQWKKGVPEWAAAWEKERAETAAASEKPTKQERPELILTTASVTAGYHTWVCYAVKRDSSVRLADALWVIARTGELPEGFTPGGERWSGDSRGLFTRTVSWDWSDDNGAHAKGEVVWDGRPGVTPFLLTACMFTPPAE